jgi:LPXTG-site transpeptidase (sortase) family protein
MPNPDGPEDVAYYDFGQWPGLGGLPGQGGNVVLAGHVDYIDYGQAVFWDLGKLKIGDRIQIRMKDGSVIEYQVGFNKHIDANANWGDRRDRAESITLITCSGEFSAGTTTTARSSGAAGSSDVWIGWPGS